MTAMMESPAITPAKSPAAPYAFAGVAALAMIATLPGRTQGLGLITVPLLDEFRLDPVEYSALNLWATLLGSLLCLPCGWLLDRIGVRAVLSVTLVALGVVVVAMSRLEADRSDYLFPLILLTRGLGQSALSVISLALLGKAAGRTPGPVVGVYSFLVSVGFMAAFGAVKAAFEFGDADWRTVWAGIGWIIVGMGAAVAIALRNPREVSTTSVRAGGATLFHALMTPAFWVFALATSLYGMVGAAVGLFGQPLLEERGFDRSVYLTVIMLGPIVGLAANIATGLLARRRGLGRLMAVAMIVLAGALLAFPMVTTLAEVYAYAVTMGVAGGMVTVVFFAVWGPAFGSDHLGKIQGAAQLLTVLASAAGPMILAVSQREFGAYSHVFRLLSIAAVLFAVAAWFVPVPRFAPSEEVAADDRG